MAQALCEGAGALMRAEITRIKTSLSWLAFLSFSHSLASFFFLSLSGLFSLAHIHLLMSAHAAGRSILFGTRNEIGLGWKKIIIISRGLFLKWPFVPARLFHFSPSLKTK